MRRGKSNEAAAEGHFAAAHGSSSQRLVRGRYLKSLAPPVPRGPPGPHLGLHVAPSYHVPVESVIYYRSGILPQSAGCRSANWPGKRANRGGGPAQPLVKRRVVELARRHARWISHGALGKVRCHPISLYMMQGLHVHAGADSADMRICDVGVIADDSAPCVYLYLLRPMYANRPGPPEYRGNTNHYDKTH